MNSFMLIVLFLASSACAQTQKPVPAITGPVTINQGEVRWFEFPIPKEEVKFLCHNKDIKFVRSGNIGQAFVMESYFSKLKPFKCKVLAGDKVIAEYPFIVNERDYFAEQLKVDPKKIKLSPKAEKRVIAEQVILNRIYASSVPRFLFTEAFMTPLNSVVTSVYGNRRVYNKQKKGQHLGIDYRAAIGDKVPSANAGKVVFAGDLFYTGWTVIIDHGVDIFTVYGHLSKTSAREGDIVKRGDLIGLSGNTGRTSGPHLHWGTKIQGQYVDGFILIEESKKNFK
jgi:murein DD-endopeptidase MepM/ murein hydrolase activator NlpD